MEAEALRKAAILINSLDARSADALLEQMSEEQAALVRRAVMELDDIDSSEQQAVIESFLATQRGDSAEPAETMPAEPPLEETTARAPDAPEPFQPAPSRPTPPERLFEFLQDVDVEAVHAFLAAEHPQTVAIVLAHLPPQQAAGVLKLLADGAKTDVLRRIAALKGTDVQVLRDVEEEMRRVFAERTFHGGDASGVSSLRAILAATDEQERSDWMEDIKQFDPRVAEQLQRSAPPEPTGLKRFPRLIEPAEAKRAADELAAFAEARQSPDDAPRVEKIQWPRAEDVLDQRTLDQHDGSSASTPATGRAPLPFETLYELDDPSLAIVLQNAPGQVVLAALAGASRAFVERLMNQLPPKAAKSLNDRIEKVGPIRLKDVELAQNKVMEIAEQLALDGKLVLPAGDRFAAAA